jgi:hypothetical protein
MLLEERGPTKTLSGRNAETDESERISEGFHLIESSQVIPRDAEGISLWLLGICEFESTGSLETRACG